jgi:hypothetical protein
MALDAALSFERLSHNIHSEMGFPARSMSRVPLVLVGFVHHPEAVGSEGLGQLSGDELLHAHGQNLQLMFGEDSMRKAVEITSYVSVKLAGGRVSSA